jgi:Prokaryotic RING finger family 1
MYAHTARLRGVSKARKNRMRNRQGVSWGFRIGLTVSLALGAAWGFLLGLALGRVNAQLSVLGILLTALPIAFVGSMLIGLVFNRLVRAWHKAARLLAAILVTAIGIPIGLALGLVEQHLNAVQLFDATGGLIWNVEWLVALFGLIAGMWHGWADPLAQFVIRIPRFYLELAARFFEMMGHVFLWAPQQVAHAVSRLFQSVREIQLPHWERPTRQAPSATPKPRRARRRFLQPHLAAPRRRANHRNGLHVGSVVEDRCPYCLDVVKRNDPRGVHICEVCGTPHHADCWAITGKCQVPHLNT